MGHAVVQVVIFVALVLAVTKPLGAYLFRVFEGDRQPLPRVLGRLERLCLRAGGVDASREQTWSQYARALLVFSALGVLVTYALLRLQGHLPGNPQGLPGVPPALAWNTAISFTTNTNWQAYAGEATLSPLSQMVALTWHNFVSSGAGIGVALVLARGLTRRRAPGAHDGAAATAPRALGNFWVDLVRATVYVLVPLCLGYAVLLVILGVPQSLGGALTMRTLEGGTQTLPMFATASQEAIKMLGTNGGGIYNANSAHPFENPTALTNLLQMVSIFAIPAALTYTYGRMARDQRQGWAVLAAMAVLFLAGAGVATWAESQPNAALAAAGVAQPAGNLEGKEIRFGVGASALFATVTTDASCGAVNAMHDSMTPLGGLVPLVNIQLGEVVFGGVGAGLYGILVFVLLAVFLAGLMVGRTPELLGKKIEPREMKLTMLYVLVFPLAVLVPAAAAAVSPGALASLANTGPHGLTEILYAFSSAAGNNGSAFAGLNANTDFWNVLLGIGMLVGRFAMIVPVLALAGAMVGKRVSPPGPGTFPTGGALFTVLLVAVVVIVGALTYFPALALGPVAEHLAQLAGGLS